MSGYDWFVEGVVGNPDGAGRRYIRTSYGDDVYVESELVEGQRVLVTIVVLDERLAEERGS